MRMLPSVPLVVVVVLLASGGGLLWGTSPVLQFAEPSSLRYTGMGGAVTAVPEGLDLLLHNPAGFTQPLPHHRSRFVLSLAPQFYFQPQYFYPILKDVFRVENTLGQILVNAKDLIVSSGTGASPNVSVGYLGRNWGLGLFVTTSAFVQGSPFPLGVEGFAMVNASLPVAYSLRIVEGRSLDISVGVSLRPSVALYKMLDGSDVDAIVANRTDGGDLLWQVASSPYLSMPADLGLVAVVHDIPLVGGQLRLGTSLRNLFGGYYVPGQSVAPLSRQLSFQLGMGAVIPFSLGRLPMVAAVSVESKDINGVISGARTFWRSLACGMELAVADFLRIWGGLSSGYPAVGVELMVGWFSAGVSWQTIESGRHVGDNPLSVFQVGISFSL